MERRLTFIGYGEAARAFAPDLSAILAAYDRKTDDSALRDAKRAEFIAEGIVGHDTPAAALASADAVLSLVTADQALAAAEASAGLTPGALWFDMNSVAPDTKHAAAAVVARRGGRYVDVAVMAPVHPKRTAVPLLVSGPHAEDGATMLSAMGFAQVRLIAGDIGAASAIKMIRSVVVKGIEALSAECALAAEAAGVLDEVVASLDASPAPTSWAERFNYNLERMMVHGTRRAAEMEEVVATLDALGVPATMSRGTTALQRRIGALSVAPAQDLAATVRALAPSLRLPAEKRAA